MSSDAMASTQEPPQYPVRLDIDYPEHLSRILIFFKWLFAIPVYFLLIFIGGGLLPVATFFAMFRRKFPRWWFDFEIALTKFQMRYGAYVLLLRDEYPAFEEDNGIHFEVEYPSSPNRWLPLVKWILALPHYVVLVLLAIGVLVVYVIAWFAILFTGKFPRGLFDYVVGYYRWNLRVTAYAQYLMTDKYPPFSLK